MKKLFRSKTNKTLYGVIGGLGEYFDIDPTILRIGFIFFTVFPSFGFGIPVYFLSVLIIPENPNNNSDETIVIINKEDK